jgi:hypothetical protein
MPGNIKISKLREISMTKNPPLTVVSGKMVATATTVIEPPATLGPSGARLWRSIMAQYDIRDAGGLAILEDACASRNNADEMAAVITQEGRMIRTKTGFKEHPLIRHETAARGLTAKLLRSLGLDVEPLRSSSGRPGRGIGVTGDLLEP